MGMMPVDNGDEARRPVIARDIMKRAPVFFLAMVLAGCSSTLPVRGQVGQGAETFEGSATGYMDGAGTLAVTLAGGGQCSGSFVYLTRRNGEGTFTCRDGRTGPFSFVSTGSRGTGSGFLNGQPVTFTFGRF